MEGNPPIANGFWENTGSRKNTGLLKNSETILVWLIEKKKTETLNERNEMILLC